MVTFGSHVGNHQFQPFLSGVYAGVIFIKLAHCVNVRHIICLVYTVFNSIHSHTVTRYRFFGGLIAFHFLSATAPLLTKVIYTYSECISFDNVSCTLLRTDFRDLS